MIRVRSYEVSIEVGGKPEIEGIYKEERAARERAEYLLKLAKYTAVRVYEVNGRDEHKVIFEKFYSGKGKTATIAEVDSSALCLTTSEVYEFDSRQTLLKLMRAYFDEQLIIPLELLHSYTALRYLERDPMMFNPAANRLAALQARQARVSAGDRRSALDLMYRDVVAQAKANEVLRPYADILAARGLGGLLAEVRATQPGPDAPRVITYAIADHLKEARDWNLKLIAACKLFEEGMDEEAADWLDEVLAEIIDGNEPVKAALGYAQDLFSALFALLAVTDGTWDDRLAGTPALQKLSDCNARRPLPRVRDALLSRVASAIDSKVPLTKLGRGGDADALKRLISLLIEFGGFRGGATMAVGLTRRAKVVFSSGVDDLSFENTVSIMCGFLPNPAGKIGYLLDLLASELGRRKATQLTQQIAELFGSLRSIHDFAPGGDVSWSQDMVREDFRRRLNLAGIPHHLAEGLLKRLTVLANAPAPAKIAVTKPAGLLPPSINESAETIMIAPARPVQTAPVPRLELSYCGTSHLITTGQAPFVIGRSSACQLAVACGLASRAHAMIEMSGESFLLTDQSKNGTVVRLGDMDPVTLSLSSTPLTGSGTIVIGEGSDAGDTAIITFQVTPKG